MIKAVLFDYGGVLAEGGKKDSARAIIGRYYGQEMPRDEYERIHLAMRCGELTTREFFGALRDTFGSARTMTETEWNEANAGSYCLSEPIYALAARLRAAGIRTGVVSNIHGFEAAHIRDIGGYDGFDPVVLSPDVRAAKPDLEIYQAALAQLDAVPGEVLFVDDQEKCLTGAQKLGMLTIKAESPGQIVDDVTDLVRWTNGDDV